VEQLDLLKRKLERERLARKQAENILEVKALELYNSNQALQVLNENLEQQVKDRTSALKKSEEIAIKAQQAEKLFLANMSHEISKIDSGTIEIHNKPLNIKSISEVLISTFKGKNNTKEVEIKCSIDPGIEYQILGDEQILNHILLNLISNAYKFTNKGSVELSVKIIAETKDDCTLAFRVSDTGIGMTDDELSKIFNKFTQANHQISDEYGGTGLGLTLAKRFVEVLGGKLKVESQKDKGSSFFFNLTLSKSAIISNSNSNNLKQISYSWPNKKVLIVEDNLMNQKYISTLLAKWGIDFNVANNGKEGVELYQKLDYDLVFMDLSMPVMDGFEACKLIRSQEGTNIKAPIIALTASTFSSKRKLALEVGMSEFLAKPFTPDQLASVLTSYFEDGQIIDEKSSSFNFSKNLDHKLLNQTYQSDLDYAYDMFSIFNEIIFDEIGLLNKFKEAKEYDEVRKLAHKIKPTFSMVGLTKFSLLMSEIEGSASKNDDVKVSSLIKQFNDKIGPSLELTRLEKTRLKSALKNKI